MPLGPSLSTVIQLSNPGDPGSVAADNPPLQRLKRTYYRPPDKVSNTDCLASHIDQIKTLKVRGCTHSA